MKKWRKYTLLLDAKRIDDLNEYFTGDELIDIRKTVERMASAYIDKLVSDKEKAKHSEHEEEA